MLWAEGLSQDPPLKQDENGAWSAPDGGWQGELTFTAEDLASRYADLAPEGQVDLVVIGCPQASLEEIRITASTVRSYAEMGSKIPDQRLWVFTSGANYDLALADGSIELLEQAGAVILKDTCPEVTPLQPKQVQSPADQLAQSRTLPHQRLESLANKRPSHSTVCCPRF